MKLNFLNARTINITISVLIILFIILIALSVLPFMIKTGSSADSFNVNGAKSIMYSTDSQLEPIDPVISDSISHRKYKHLTDSIKESRNMKNGMLSGGSASTLFIGATRLERCEHCSMWDDDQLKVEEYFISLHWWTLDTANKSMPVRYYVKDGKQYLRKTICKPGRPLNGYNEQYNCKEVDIVVPFRYDAWTKSMLIPVSEQAVNVLNVILITLSILLILYTIYYIIGGFFKFLLEIAAGTPFSDRNVSRLKRITLSLLLIPLIVFLLNLLMRLVFYKYFTEDIKLSQTAWSVLWKPLILSVIFAALYFAFKQGKKLKEEQDLTI